MRWHDDPPLVKMPAGAAGPALVPTEQSPYAQWWLNRTSSNMGLANQSMLDRTATKGATTNSVGFAPDLIRPEVVFYGLYGSGPYETADFNDPRFNGELTLCGRAWHLFDIPTANNQAIVSADGCRWLNVQANTGKLLYHHYQGATTVSTALVAPPGRWFWWSLRRNAARDQITFEIDGVFETLAASPGSPIYPRLNIGQNLSFSGERWDGVIADVNVWLARLTDADMVRFRKIAMGL